MEYFGKKYIEQDRNFQWGFKETFGEINEVVSDYDTLILANEVLKVARDRLTGDLDKENIKNEFIKLNDIVNELNDIINNYV